MSNYRFMVNEITEVKNMESYSNYDLNDYFELESLFCEIGKYVLDWIPKINWPIEVKLLDNVDGAVFCTGSVDMYLEPEFEAYVERVDEKDD